MTNFSFYAMLGFYKFKRSITIGFGTANDAKNDQNVDRKVHVVLLVNLPCCKPILQAPRICAAVKQICLWQS